MRNVNDSSPPPFTGEGAGGRGLLLLTLADDELVIGWSDSEWTGIAPVLEEDVAMSSIAQDEIGHALAFFELLCAEAGGTPDEWAFQREPADYRCALLAGRSEGAANVVAAALGIVTPFCSCSAVPLFIGFVQAGVPLGVTFSFLISAPMVNEVALALLFALFGWKIAALYLGLGLAIAVLAGWVIGRLRMESYLEDWVREMPRVQASATGERLSLADRVDAGLASVRTIVGKVWPYIVAGVAVGASIHGWVPQDFMASFMGKSAWWSVPLAVAIGVPMYSNAAGIIPVVQALLAKGAALGTVLAFMMSVIALSLPEMIILRKVLTWRLIATFIGVVAAAILLVGFVFNALL